MSKDHVNFGDSKDSLLISSKDMPPILPPPIFAIVASGMSLLNFVRNHNHKERNEMDNNECNSQTHVHEFEGSTKLAEEGEDRHNHRFAGVTTQKIPFPDGHRHVVFTNTDFFENHHHEIGALSGPPIPVGDGKHVHFFSGNSTMDDGHFHEFQFTTLIDSPLT